MNKRATVHEYALLGIVGLGDKSPYDIRKLFRDTPMMQFSSSPGSIYPALKRLEARDLLESTVCAGERGSKKRLYRLSGRGEDCLCDWLREPPVAEDVATDIRVLLLKFTFMEPWLDSEEVLAYLENLEPLLIEYREKLQGYEAAFEDMDALHARLGITNGIMAFTTHINWVRRAQSEIRERNDVVQDLA